MTDVHRVGSSACWTRRRGAAGAGLFTGGDGTGPYTSQRRASGRASVGVRTEWFAFLKNRLRLGRRRIRHGNSPIERHVGAGSSLPSAEAGGPRPPTLTRRRTTLA